VLGLVAVGWSVPLILALNASVKSEAEFTATSVWEPPQNFTLANFIQSFIYMEFPLKVANSLIISFGALALSLVIAIPVAYAITIGRHRWRTFVLATCVVIFLMPQEAFAYPIFLVAKMVHMYGNVIFLIFPLGLSGAAFATFLLGMVMSRFPTSVVDAAEIDGASRWQTLTRVVLPMMTPSIVEVGLLLFITNWNEYLLTLLLLPDSSSMTVPLAVSMFNYGQMGGPPTTIVAAASILGAIPSLIVFLLFHRSLTRGITAGAID
jgi:raffinose/stachyose/melibiose transport system permease protein